MAITKGSSPSPSPTPTSPGEAAGAAQFGSTATSSSGQVWMPVAPFDPTANGLTGRDLNSLSESAQAQLSRRQQSGGWWSVTDAESAYYNWTDKQRADFRAKALVGGLLKLGDGDIEAGTLWKNLVDQASLYGAQGKPVAPTDLLAGYVKANSAGGQWVKQGNFEINSLTGEKRYIGPQFKTTTATATNLTDPATARAVATSMFQQLLGRDPGADEIQAYATALAQSEIQNPGQTTTTTQFDMLTGDPTNTSSVSTGGMTDQGRAQLAMDAIKKKKEFGATQAATTYTNALESAVGV